MDWLKNLFGIDETQKSENETHDIFNSTPEERLEAKQSSKIFQEDIEQKEEEKKREVDEKAIEDQLVVIHGAKIKMSTHLGELSVLNDVPTTQDKLTGTIIENQIPNFIFTDGFQVLSIDGDWQNYGTYKVQDNEVLLKKSKIQITGKMPGNSPTETGFVEFIDSGQINIPDSIETKGAPVPEQEELDFDIKLSLNKNKKYSTLVPLGISDFDGNYENPVFAFNYTLLLNDVDSLEFKILNDDGHTIYSMINLPEIIITAKSKVPLLENDLTKQKTTLLKNGTKIWDWKSIFDQYILPPNDYTKVGSYVLFWDGFNNEGIYDSTHFNNKTLKAVIVAKKGNRKKTTEVEFFTKYDKVDWVDVKIDKNSKRIDATLRVNLKDGGAEGLESIAHTESESTISGEKNPFSRYSTKISSWDKIPQKTLNEYKKEPIKERTKSFSDLEKLALEGLNYHWGRNQNHAVAKDVKINEEAYEVYVDAKNTKTNAMDDVELIYNTNGDWLRSGNPGSATLNPISWVGNAVSREAICYNVGYIKYSKGWGYNHHSNEDIDFKFTAAHEIGHEILKSYGGTVYSYGHKGSVHVVTQSMKKNAIDLDLRSNTEIDIMPYYESSNKLPMSSYKRYVASEKDVLNLIYLTKIKIQ